MAFAGPVHHGLPSRQPRRRDDSGLRASGRSSASGAASRHALQEPASERVRNETVPGPCQCRPTRSNRDGVAAARARSPWSGTSREVIVAGSARASAGKRSRQSRAMRRILMRAGCLQSAALPLLAQDAGPFLSRILTAVNARLLRGFRASLATLAALALAGSTAAAAPRVLAVQFENDVNPVTQ